MKRMFGILVIWMVVGFLGCGGKSTNPNGLPVSNAGTDMSAETGDTVYLDGSASEDPEGETLSYTWVLLYAQQRDQSIILTGPTTPSPHFVPETPGTYHFSLTVNDGVQDGISDTVYVYVSQANRTPIADAGISLNRHLNVDFIRLDGTNSEDPDDDQLSFKWIEHDENPVTGLLINRTTANPSFTPTVVGDYRFILTVNDGQLTSLPTTVLVTVTPNSPPIADAGMDVNGKIEESITLNGSSSSDPDGDAISQFIWLFWLGNLDIGDFEVEGMGSNEMVMTANDSGEYFFGLMVYDGMDWSKMDRAEITCNPSSGKATFRGGAMDGVHGRGGLMGSLSPGAIIGATDGPAVDLWAHQLDSGMFWVIRVSEDGTIEDEDIYEDGECVEMCEGDE